MSGVTSAGESRKAPLLVNPMIGSVQELVLNHILMLVMNLKLTIKE